MSIQLIQKYYAEVEKLIRYGGSRNESSLRQAFIKLLEGYAASKNLVLVPELELLTGAGRRVIPDGTLKDALRQDWGYWESKDEADDIEEEIKKKFAKGYPRDNILFEDTQTAILYQSGERVIKADFENAEDLDTALRLFVGYEPKEVTDFREAIQKFNEDVPALVEELRSIIQEQLDINPEFKGSLDEFLALCRTAINPNVEMADMREMIVQHVLTEDIFMTVFDEPAFHRENNVAHKLQEVARPLFQQAGYRAVHGRIAPYYETINARAAQIYDHTEKQKFLKALYENFYRAYNPKGADRLGIIYTPNEIVRFMIESADHLCYKHFGKGLGDQGVEILDPATGTGTFITEIIEYLPLAQLDYKYEHELHCNEVAILPYYIANLNIEYTYKQKTGQYKQFENICFVDTLDNLGFTRDGGQQMDFFAIMDENAERITRQNTRKISVVIGNPPYNANQLNENENNKNREYPGIDQRIKDTYIKESNAQKTKLYDMYARFYRWASDRLDKNGIVVFITNNSYLDSLGFDGFRKVVGEEFSHIYILDLGGDVRKNRKLSGTTHNVFGIQIGVAIAFMVKSDKKEKTLVQISYARRPEFELATEKLAFLRTENFQDVRFENIHPDKNHNWLNVSTNDWDELMPVALKESKSGKKVSEPKSIFNLFSTGISTNRDEWVVDLSKENLIGKMSYFVKFYEDALKKHKKVFDTSIKWSRNLKQRFDNGAQEQFDASRIATFAYRPYCQHYLYYSAVYIDENGLMEKIFEPGDNVVLCFTNPGSQKPFMSLSCNKIPDLHLAGAGAGTQCLPLYRYAEDGERVENITDWALKQFQKQYKDKTISKEDIFHYVYAVLHHPAYREKYEINLKREFPRIPYYEDFHQWAEWGKRLMDLHLNYETVKPYPLEREDIDPESTRKAYKATLRAREESGIIEVDTYITLSGVPAEAWEYQLGTYSALGWILERYKEKKPRDPTIREKFNTYKFADYKEQVIDLLRRVCTVSVGTMKIVKEMPQ